MSILVGKIFESQNSGKFKTISYKDGKVKIKFIKTGYTKWTTSSHIRLGKVKDPYHPRLYGKGYVGEGKFTNKLYPKLYKLWQAMLMRCYDSKTHARLPTYVGCKVVKRWHNFQLFCEDIIKMKNWNVRGFQLDKDLRVLGNKTYGPKYCSFVPSRINTVLLHEGDGVSEYLTGFVVKMRQNGRKTYLGTFNTRDKAVKCYKEAKSSYVNSIAREYKKIIHPEVYQNLATYGLNGW